MGEDALIGFTTIFLMFGTPLLLGLLVFAGWWINLGRKTRQIERARDTYERLAREKLDVIKTAIAMGHSDQDIRDLDSRLERLIGADKLGVLLDPQNPKPPKADMDLLNVDLMEEVNRLSGDKGKSRQR